MDILSSDERQPQAPSDHLVCGLLLPMERKRVDFVLSQHRPGQHRLHILANTKSHQRFAADMGSRDKRLLCPAGQQIREKNALPSFDGSRPCNFHWRVKPYTT